jgi:hypothetical protein
MARRGTEAEKQRMRDRLIVSVACPVCAATQGDWCSEPDPDAHWDGAGSRTVDKHHPARLRAAKKQRFAKYNKPAASTLNAP